MLDKFKYIKPIFDVRNELETQMLLLVDEQVKLKNGDKEKRDSNLKELVNVQIKLKQIYIFKDSILKNLMMLSDITSSNELNWHVTKMIELEIDSIKMSMNELNPKKKDYQMALDIHKLDLEIMEHIKAQYNITTTCSECKQDFITDDFTATECNNCL